MIIVSKKDVTCNDTLLTHQGKQQKKNAIYVYQFLRDNGWEFNPIIALIGNLYRESHINPGLHESGGSGFGLVQWTPKSKYTNWTGRKSKNEGDIDDQLARIIWEKDNGQQWQTNRYSKGYNISFKDFIKDTTHSLQWLVEAFCWNYEGPSVPAMEERIEGANFYYDYILTNCVFEPRLSENKPTSIKNKYYTKPGYKGPDDNKNGVNICVLGNPTEWSGSVLSNCIGYAWGRLYEITGKAPDLSDGGPGPDSIGPWLPSGWTLNDARKGKSITGPNGTKYKTGIEPKLGAIACWGYQHAAVVEEIDKENKKFTTSNSAWGRPLFYTQEFQFRKDGNYTYKSTRPFYGFIYIIDFNLSNYEDEIDYAPMIESVTQESDNDLNCIIWENKDTITITGYVNGKEDITTGLSVYVSWDNEIPSISKHDIIKEIKLEKNKDGKWVAING